MVKNKLYFIFLIIGVFAGVSFGLMKAKASSPEPPADKGGEVTASVYYDETWNATAALVSGENGYRDFDPSANSKTQTAAKFDNSDGKIIAFPKFVVKEWTVHGHIHFE
jgi:hypothetical protein